MGPRKTRRTPAGSRRSVATLPKTSLANARQNTLRQLRLQNLSRHLYELGPRSVLEFVSEVAATFGEDVVERLEAYGRLDAAALRALGADSLPASPLRVVAGLHRGDFP